jgi:hypothetical protein
VAIMGLICGYCKECKMPSGYYGTHMRVLQWMQNACGYCWTYMQVLHIKKWPYGVHNREWCKYYMF